MIGDNTTVRTVHSPLRSGRRRPLLGEAFCARVNWSEMWTSLQQILKPYQRLHIRDLGPVDGVWTIEDNGKVAMLAQRFFPAGPSTPEFQLRSERRRQEVEEWLAEEWEDVPTVTQEEVL